ncbi:MAG: hypothetical protein U0Z44_20110 [Kouleothrix sp.]|nr:hypothetical protein [Kouleothrix sp.]
MPRVHLYVQDLEAIEELEEHADWEQRVGLNGTAARRDARPGDTRGERRFGGAEALARKRADRRKNVVRATRRD